MTTDAHEVLSDRPLDQLTTYDCALFRLIGPINEELNKMGADGWQPVAFLPQPPEQDGRPVVLVPAVRPKGLLSAIGTSTPLTEVTAYECDTFLIDGDINLEMRRLGDEGWQPFAFIPQPPGPGGQKVLVPALRPRRLIQGAAGNGVQLLH